MWWHFFVGQVRKVLCVLVLLPQLISCEDNNGTCSFGAGCIDKGLTIESVPQKILDAEYAVRGEIVTRSYSLEKQLEKQDHGLPFDELVACNIGNPQAVGAKPVTFHRQVLSLLSNPSLLEEPAVASLYPPDVISRAKEYVGKNPKFGAYSHSKGIPFFRQKVAEYINRRDGALVPAADPEDIYLTDGASAGVKTVLEVMIGSPLDGVLIPIPQYPLYSAAITRLGGTFIGYELMEDYTSGKGWAIDVDLIQKKIEEFLAGGGRVRGIAVINPGNPTGTILTRDVVEAVVRLCAKYKIVILADEVYQDNIFRQDREFVSFRRVVHELDLPVELFSFHSMSKGYYGECGLRGGVMQLTNIDPEVADQIYKLFSMILCANTLGQALMASILNPPQPGDASFQLFEQERSQILANLSRKADLVTRALNHMPGVQSLPVEGAMYAFPQVYLPQKFVQEAESLGKAADMLYCIKMLEATGVIVVPGSGFAQRNGTWHYRITILPEEDKLKRVLARMTTFHLNFLERYLSPSERAIEDKTPTPCLPKYSASIQTEIVEAHLKGKPAQEKPWMLLMLGGAGAGKSSLLNVLTKHGMDVGSFVRHGLDEYIEYLPEYKASVQKKLVVYKDAADGCYAGAIPIAKAAQLEIIRRKQHLVYEETGKDLNRITKRVLPVFEEAGYSIAIALVDNDPEMAKQRSLSRFMKGGRYAPDSYIESTFKNVPENYAKLKEMTQVKEAYYCNNNCIQSDGECLRCWVDKGERTLLPSAAMSSGPVQRLHAASR
ncbi:Probable alanine aminotransferase [Durusdinium trenchii]|uniref:Mitochondrial (ALT) (Glutamate pyruvate transaminase) (GPT) (Glutamic--alanine transaminase) (Glutamic--pyruvic transaminase) n=2 Tax=Durusdinium trenchii TaxID=1381693 RepID=A0ABP0QD06_9DINO